MRIPSLFTSSEAFSTTARHENELLATFTTGIVFVSSCTLVLDKTLSIPLTFTTISANAATFPPLSTEDQANGYHHHTELQPIGLDVTIVVVQSVPTTTTSVTSSLTSIVFTAPTALTTLASASAIAPSPTPSPQTTITTLQSKWTPPASEGIAFTTLTTLASASAVSVSLTTTLPTMTPLASASNFQSISTAAAIIGGMTLVIGIIGLIIKLHKLDKKSAVEEIIPMEPLGDDTSHGLESSVPDENAE